MKRVIITILLIAVWITIPGSFLLAQGAESLVSNISDRVDNTEDLIRDTRRLQRDLDRLGEISSPADRAGSARKRVSR